VFLADRTAAMTTYCATKMTTASSTMTWYFCDTMFVAPSDKDWL